MNYTDLTTNIKEVVENPELTDAQIALFVQQTEQKIYNTVQLPALRKTCDGATTGSNQFLSTPADFLFPYSIALRDGDGNYNYLVQVDQNFIRQVQDNLSTMESSTRILIFWVQPQILVIP